MAVFRPFKAVRPLPAFASKVAALTYDVMNSKEAAEMVKDNPYSFLHVDKAEIDLPAGTDLYMPAKPVTVARYFLFNSNGEYSILKTGSTTTSILLFWIQRYSASLMASFFVNWKSEVAVTVRP